jgi:hypothetical protein
LTVYKRNILAVFAAGGDGRRFHVANNRSTGFICIPSDYDVGQNTLPGIYRTHPIPVSAIYIQRPDSGVGMRPTRDELTQLYNRDGFIC